MENKKDEKKDFCQDTDCCETEKGKEVVLVEKPPPAEPFMPCEAETTDAEVKHLLPPDHPLLARFQQSLKELLLRIKNQLTDEIAEINHKIKLKEQEREDFGVKLYDVQHEIEKQNDMLEEYSQDIRETVNKRIEAEHLRDTLKADFEEKSALTKEHKYKYNERLMELARLQELETNIRQWTADFELQLMGSKRVVSKDIALQKAAAEEKMQIDLMSFNLQVEMKKRQEELNGLMKQISEQTAINEILHRSLADADADLSELNQEHKRLNQAWGEVIVAIGHRDKVLYQARTTLENQHEELKLTYASIEGTKKQVAKETEQHTKLETFKARLANDLVQLKKDTDKQAKILAKLEQKMEELPIILDQTEKDFQMAKKEGAQLLAKLNTLQFKLERKYAIKTSLEEAILKLAQNQLMCDKANEYRLKVLHEHQDGRRLMEMNYHKIEKQLANLLSKCERQKNTNNQLREEGNELNAVLKGITDETDDINNEIKNINVQVGIKMKIMDKLSKELDILIKEAAGCEVSPTELKLRTMEKAIQETDQKVVELQQFWLILQGHIVHLSQKRNSQLNDIQVARKQLMIITQKSLKIDDEIEKAENSTNEIDRQIQNFNTKLELFSAKMFQKRKQHEANEFGCEMEHFEMLHKLKDNEMRVLNIEQETLELQSDIEQYKKEVLDLHREALSWETKFKLLDETLRWRRKETAIESEIGVMRAEIHRMEIRYHELRRAQEKLIEDLDHCVMHRERIFVLASNRQKTEGLQFRSRTNIQQRLNDVRTKLRQVNYEINAAEKRLTELSKIYFQMEEEKNKVQKTMEVEIEQDRRVVEEIEQAMLLRQQNLDNIIHKQNRTKQYRRLTASALRPKQVKSETSLEFNTSKEKEINHHLNEVVGSLMIDHPEKKFVLLRIQNSLKEP